jgi:dephospho-CoA kinase
MKKFKYNPNKPIIVGLAGKAATGKTSVAEKIVPKAKVDLGNNGIVWDHIFFALPLYELAAIKKGVIGSRQTVRQLYGIHDTLYDLFGNSPIGDVPPYEDMVSMVQAIQSMPIEPEGLKPRTFLQKAGDECRSHDPECFCKWAIRKANSLHLSYVRSLLEDTDPSPFAVVVSDVRYLNEAQTILDQENGMIVCYTASDKVRNERMFSRDGRYMTEEQMNHSSELQIDDIAKVCNVVINTDDLTVEDQTLFTLDYVNSLVGTYA